MVVPIFVLVSVDCYFGSYFLDIWLVIRTGVSFRLHYDQVTCGTNKNQVCLELWYYVSQALLLIFARFLS